MSLKEVMDEYFNGVKIEPKLKVRNLMKRPRNLEEVRKKSIGKPLVNKMLKDYYCESWMKEDRYIKYDKKQVNIPVLRAFTYVN